MRAAFTFFLFIPWYWLSAQDKVYLLNGSALEGKVYEITLTDVVLRNGDSEENVPKNEVLLIEFRNGHIERITPARENIVFHPPNEQNNRRKEEIGGDHLNNISMNTLALVNADVSVFLERLSRNKQLGAGVMAAYNFNQTASLFNNYIYILSNPRKILDAGVFLNYYPARSERKRSLYVGVLFKYTSFSYSFLNEDTVWNGSQRAINVSYSPRKGSQLATIFTLGSQINLSRLIYIRTVAGIGGFNLRGDYQQQYNYMRARFSSTAGNAQVKFRPKVYLGLNIGYVF